jgi:hypothetical protein
MNLPVPADQARAWFQRRLRHADLLRQAVLGDLERLLKGEPAQFVIRYEDLREEVLWVCMTYGVTLACPLRYKVGVKQVQ